jgi:hypothetical protein
MNFGFVTLPAFEVWQICAAHHISRQISGVVFVSHQRKPHFKLNNSPFNASGVVVLTLLLP